MKKRGQAEMIGFAIVVILLIFAFIFFIKVKSGEDENETRLIRTNLRANSALNALMKVDVDEKRQMKELIEGCSEDSLDEVCELAYGSLERYLGALFEGGGYYMRIIDQSGVDKVLSYKREGEEKSFIFGSPCERGISASSYILKYSAKVEFRICT